MEEMFVVGSKQRLVRLFYILTKALDVKDFNEKP